MSELFLISDKFLKAFQILLDRRRQFVINVTSNLKDIVIPSKINNMFRHIFRLTLDTSIANTLDEQLLKSASDLRIHISHLVGFKE